MKYYLVVFQCIDNKNGEIINHQLNNTLKIVPEGTISIKSEIDNMFFIEDKDDKVSEFELSNFYRNICSSILRTNYFTIKMNIKTNWFYIVFNILIFFFS